MFISIAVLVLAFVFIVVLGPFVVIFSYLLLRRRAINKRELQDLRREISQMKAEIGDIKEQIADLVIKSY